MKRQHKKPDRSKWKRRAIDASSRNFRILAGSSQPFIHILEYEGPSPFSDAEVFVVSPKTGIGLSLSPLYYWGLNLCEGRNIEPDLYEYDSAKKDGKFSFKAVQLAEAVTISGDGYFGEIWKSITNLRERDQAKKTATGLAFTSSNFSSA